MNQKLSKFVEEWKLYMKDLPLQLVIKDGEKGERTQEIPQKNVFYWTQSLSINLTYHDPIVVTSPFEIGVVAVPQMRKIGLKKEKIYFYAKEKNDYHFYYDTHGTMRVELKLADKKVLLRSVTINMHGHQILCSLNSKQFYLSVSKKTDSSLHFGLRGFDVHITFRSTDQILKENDSCGIRVHQVDSIAQSIISFHLSEWQNVLGEIIFP